VGAEALRASTITSATLDAAESTSAMTEEAAAAVIKYERLLSACC